MKNYLHEIEKRSFEENLQELERISQAIESEDLPLNDTLEYYQKATLIANFLNSYLENVKGKITQFRDKVEDGEIITTNFFKEENTKEKPKKDMKKDEDGLF